MSASPPSESEPLPPSRFILDLDQPLQLEALLEALQLLQAPPKCLENPGEAARWRGQVWVRLSYLLMHCSLTRSGFSRGELVKLAESHSQLAQRLLSQDWRLEIVSRR